MKFERKLKRNKEDKEKNMISQKPEKEQIRRKKESEKG